MEQAQKKAEAAEGISLLGLYLRNLNANLLGILIITVLNFCTPLEFFKAAKVLVLTQGGWKIFVFVIPFVLLLLGYAQHRVQRPIKNLAVLISKGGPIPEDMARKGKKRLLNLPFIIILINLVTYIVMPALIVTVFYLFRDASIRTCLFLFVRAFMIGLVTASLSFFLIEGHARKTLIPFFFSEGRLAQMEGTVGISILRRIRLLNGAGTINPMVILLTTLAFISWETRGSSLPAAELAREIFIFSLVLCGIFIVIALRLNVLVGHSILRPIGAMLGVVGRVKEGDFTRRIHVSSNDELGVLGDAGNDMIRGLADRERIMETFGKYVTPEIRDQILAGRIPVKGERREATLLFSDLRAFTSYVEENNPEEVILSMREYFTAMQGAIRKHQGLVLQYVGDEIEAVFNVPVEDRNHAENALRAAIEMRKSLEKLNSERVSRGKIPFRHGIGITTGSVLAGNTGSEDRLSYALIGNTVNLASRIQGLTKDLQWDILVSQETVQKLSRTFSLHEESPQNIKGYSLPVTVYKVMG